MQEKETDKERIYTDKEIYLIQKVLLPFALLLIIVLIYFTAFANQPYPNNHDNTIITYNNEYLFIKSNVSVEEYYMPDTFILNIKVVSNGDNEKEVMEGLNKGDAVIRQLKYKYITNGIRVYPVYTYQDKTKQLISYQGYINYEFRFDNALSSNKLMQALTVDNTDFNIEITGNRWEIGESKLRLYKKELYNKLIGSIQDYSNVMSASFSRLCSIGEVDFNQYIENPLNMRAMADVKTDKQLVKISAKVQLVCK
jgi:hypothetical protein